MSQTDDRAHQALPGTVVLRTDHDRGDAAWADLRPATTWVRSHWVLVCGLALIAVQLAWKAQFLGNLFFRQDDFHDLDLAVGAPFSWHYLTFIGAGHLIIGLRVAAWLLVRTSLYNWGLASAVTLALVACANLAALRLLRLLFGDRPAILIPLLVYCFSPLTLPDIGEWSSALESVPLQLAIFMALYSQVRYVQTGRRRHLASAVGWVAFGLVFFEKGLVLPLLLFAVTAGFLMGGGSLLANVREAFTRYWRAWLLYAAVMVAYLVVLRQALHTSTTQPGAPGSAQAVVVFGESLLHRSLVPGAVGGPWQWLPVPGGSFAFAAAPAALAWVALLIVVAVLAVSIWYRPVAWRAWAILIGWVLAADMLPVVISRLGDFSAAVLGTETRYLADAMPVLALSVGLAFWPLRDQQATIVPRRHRSASSIDRLAYNVSAVLIGLFVVGSVWSAQAYENVTTGRLSAIFIANARQAVRAAPAGTPVADIAVSGNMVEGLFGSFALESTIVGDIAPGKLHWLGSPSGTIDGMRMFGPNGELYQSMVFGTSSLPLPAGLKCWPVKHGRIVVPFSKPSPSNTVMLRIGYLWFSQAPGVVTVQAGRNFRQLAVEPGLHSGYVPITGIVRKVSVVGLGGIGLCVGDAQAGNLRPNLLSQPIAPLPKSAQPKAPRSR